MSPCSGEDLLVFNDSITHPCGMRYLPLSLGEGESERKSFVINIDLKAARRILEVTLNSLLTTSTVSEEGLRRVNMVDLDVRQDRVRPIMDDNFEVIQLDGIPIISMKIGYVLPSDVKTMLIRCLWDNTYLFVIYSHELLNMDPIVTCHELNVDPSPDISPNKEENSL
ncbi:hypothetical protein KIW84_012327 [Lathyrus oleraceus]|uniref:Uncharacterized protein n=1 Tax=Pisum sativum TaxID=3888 RepID=A0A9D5BHE9_PEA|nr:hypothetical protein KIW84_012327 [Pisum sativum]